MDTPIGTLRIIFAGQDDRGYGEAIRILRSASIEFTGHRAVTTSDVRKAQEDSLPDCIIVCGVTRTSDDSDLLRTVRERDELIPFIVIADRPDEGVATALLSGGATDYVISDHLVRLPFILQRSVAKARMMKEAEQRELRLVQSEAKYRTVFDGSDVPMFIIDPDELVIMEANSAAVLNYGWSKEQFSGKPVTELNTLDHDALKEVASKAKYRVGNTFNLRHRKSDGTVIEVEVYTSPIELEGQTRLLSIVHDVTRRRMVESQRDAAEQKLSHYLATSPTISYSMVIEKGSSRLVWVSENIQRILGYSVTEATATEWWFDHVHPDDRTKLLTAIADLTSTTEAVREYRFLRKDRKPVWMRDIIRLHRTDSGSVEFVGTLIEIEQTRLLEARLQLEAAALEAADNAVLITDRNGVIEWINEAYVRLSGYTREESIGHKPRDLVHSGAQGNSFYSSLWSTIQSGKVWRGTIVNRRKSGEHYTEEMTITPVLDESGSATHYVAIKNDVSGRMLLEEELRASITERELLLREVHHRVKNNMQIVSSLINLSSFETGNDLSGPAFADLARRIQAIATVHDLFYSSEDLSTIDLSRYIEGLVASALEQCCDDSVRPEITLPHGRLDISLEQAIPAGLILSELVAAHIRENRSRGSCPDAVTVKVEGQDGHAVVEVHSHLDSGSLKETSSVLDPMSTDLVTSLAAQLGGAILFLRNSGWLARFSFPLKGR